MGKFDRKKPKFGYKNKKNHFNGKRDEQNKPYEKNSNYQSTEERTKVSLREDQVGITEYVSTSTLGFTAVIKSRYSDFHVNEIDLDNKVLVLNDISIPDAKDETTVTEDSVCDARAQFKDIITDEQWTRMEQLATKGKEAPAAVEEIIEIDIDSLDKDKRTEIHNIIKTMFSGKVVSTTVTKEVDSVQKRFLRVAKAKGKRDEKRVKWTFPGEYVKFLVHKENMDTTEVASCIARNLSLMPSKVNYCGTKDKRAITTQMFCVKKRKPSDIAAAVRNIRNVHIGNFSFADEVVKLGQLNGNRFRIALRHINAVEDVMVKALEQLKKFGFINYFGMQRFGNCVDIPTYEIGIALMKADYKTACELILKPREGDIPFLKNIRETWWKNRNSKEAAAMFRSDRFIEKKLLDGLVRHGENDYATALRKLPRNLLLLYPHAFQSLIFNRIASRRIKTYGLQLIPGDLVYSSVNAEKESDIVESDLLDESIDNIKDDDDNNVEATVEDMKQKVYILTEADIKSSNYTIYDILLPLPGYNIQYPNNEINKWYEEALHEYGLTSSSFDHSIKTFKLSGAYRKLLTLPKDFTWEFCCYNETNAQLIRSDWDVLNNIELPNCFPIEKATTATNFNRALILEFSLSPASYATMLLRELLKADTSSANQCSIEVEAKANKQNSNISSDIVLTDGVAKDVETKETFSKDPEDMESKLTTKRAAEFGDRSAEQDNGPENKALRIT